MDVREFTYFDTKTSSSYNSDIITPEWLKLLGFKENGVKFKWQMKSIEINFDFNNSVIELISNDVKTIVKNLQNQYQFKEVCSCCAGVFFDLFENHK